MKPRRRRQTLAQLPAPHAPPNAPKTPWHGRKPPAAPDTPAATTAAPGREAEVESGHRRGPANRPSNAMAETRTPSTPASRVASSAALATLQRQQLGIGSQDLG